MINLSPIFRANTNINTMIILIEKSSTYFICNLSNLLNMCKYVWVFNFMDEILLDLDAFFIIDKSFNIYTLKYLIKSYFFWISMYSGKRRERLFNLNSKLWNFNVLRILHRLFQLYPLKLLQKGLWLLTFCKFR